MDEYLPIGAHLLPQEFQDFLYGWNKTITDAKGWWMGEPRKLYRKENPERWAAFETENRRLSQLYAKELAELKAYQASYED